MRRAPLLDRETSRQTKVRRALEGWAKYEKKRLRLLHKYEASNHLCPVDEFTPFDPVPRCEHWCREHPSRAVADGRRRG